MNRLVILIVCLSGTLPTEVFSQRLSEHLTKEWSTYIGLTTFRTNFKIYKDWLIIGSNGDHLNDPMYMDENAGVKIIELKTGEIIKTLEEGEFWDTDVNGVEIIGDRLYFGNDNEEFFCYNLKNLKEEWVIRTSGDIECAPALSDIDGDGTKELIIATEAGEISAVSPKDGSYLWTYRVPSFEGYASSNTNIIAFKIFTTFRTAGTHFYTTPLMDDVNGDRIKDAIVSSQSYSYCINGKDGSLIWRAEGGFYTNKILKYQDQYLVKMDWKEDDNPDQYHFEKIVPISKAGHANQRLGIQVPKNYKGTDFVVNNDKIITPFNDGIAQVDIKTGKTRVIYFPDILSYERFPDGEVNFSKPSGYDQAPESWEALRIPYITVKTLWKDLNTPTSIQVMDILPEWEESEYCFHFADRLVVVKNDFSALRLMAIGQDEIGKRKQTEMPPVFFKKEGQQYYLSATSDGILTLFSLK